MQLDPHMLKAERSTKDLIAYVNMLCSAADVSARARATSFVRQLHNRRANHRRNMLSLMPGIRNIS
jgi:hypothetical protein